MQGLTLFCLNLWPRLILVIIRYMRPARVYPELRLRGFVISTLLYLVIMVITAALFVSFGYKLIFKEEPNASPTTQLPPDVQNQQADTVDETANWKTYTNLELGYSIQYPSNWESKEYKKPNHSFEVSKGEDFVGVYVNYEEVPCGGGETRSETIKISGQNGKKISCLKNGKVENISLFFPNVNNNSYFVVGDIHQESNLVQQILSTFKFTD